MASSFQAAVTPAGIRDGDPAALAALVERRANAVLSYCEALCPAETAERAAAEAFARFRAAVAAADDPRALDPETLLLGATRHAAASMTAPTLPPPAGGLRGRLGAGRAVASETCALIPDLLAARADGALSAADQERLARHLERHAACRALAVAVDLAEATYASPLPRTVPIGALTEIMLALAGAAPITAAPTTDFEFAEVLVAEAQLPQQPEAPRPGPGTVAPEPEASPPETGPQADGPAPGSGPEPSASVPGPQTGAPKPRPEPDPGPGAASSKARERRTGRAAPGAGAGDGGSVVASAPVEDHAAHTLAFPPIAPSSVAATSPGGVALPRPPRRPLHLPSAAPGRHGVVYRWVLPGSAVAAALVVAMGVAGVFASDDDRPASARPSSTNTPAAPPTGAPPVTPRTDVEAEERAAMAAQRRARRVRAAASARRREREAAVATIPAPAEETEPPAVATPAPEPDPTPATPTATPRKPPSTVEAEPPADSSSAPPGPGTETGTPTTPPAAPGVFEGTPAPAP